ncbi:MAG: hypothetical protein IJQ95_03655 [Paludibacteraceae bacterium]|nr:hypothetical protein [Paludibacteraceae bacterium]
MLSKQDEREINALRNLREGLRWGLIREIRGKLCGTEYVCRSTEEVDAILEAAGDSGCQ